MLRILAVAVTAVVLGFAPGARASGDQVIAAGVSAGGVDLGGLTVQAAAARLQDRSGPRLQVPLVLMVAGHRFAIDPAELRAQLDAPGTAQRAAAVTAPTGPVDVGLTVVTDAGRVAAQAERVRLAVRRSARSARLVRITSRGVSWRRARVGLEVDASRLAGTIATLAAQPEGRRVTVAVRRIRPARTDGALRRMYPSIVTVDKRTFTLRLFVGLRRVSSYRIAHGQPAYPTPSGQFRIRSKQVNPDWYVPNAPWAGELGGSVVAGGSPQNPLRARWMGLAGGIGIHGTSEEGSIGSRASHGCVRMRVRDVVRLYRRVRVGTPVVIG